LGEGFFAREPTGFPARPAKRGGLKASVRIFPEIGSDFNQNIPPAKKPAEPAFLLALALNDFKLSPLSYQI